MAHESQESLFADLIKRGYNFFTGVPDSGLKDLQNKIIDSEFKNVIAAHESQAMGIAFGAELAGKKSCVYIQNSGLGNLVNPITSLCIPFNICPLVIVGHRHTLPQHKIMGKTDKSLLDLIEYKNYIIVYGDNNAK